MPGIKKISTPVDLGLSAIKNKAKPEIAQIKETVTKQLAEYHKESENLTSQGFRGKGQMTDAVKEMINHRLVRNILKNKYGITKKDIKMVDRTGPFKIELLSERNCLRSYDYQTGQSYPLPQTAGLVINPRKGSGYPVTVVTAPNHQLGSPLEELRDPEIKNRNQDLEFFAFCMKKTVDMIKVYVNGVKEHPKHSINKELQKQFENLERPTKTKLKDYKSAYEKYDITQMKKVENFFETMANKREQLESTAQAEREISQSKLKETVIEQWEKIQKEEYIPDTPESKIANKRRVKALDAARKWERRNKEQQRYSA